MRFPYVCLVGVAAVLACSRSPRAVQARSASFDSALAVGESIYYRGEYDQVRALWRDALARARTLDDSTAQARLLTWLGLVAWRQGDYPLARQLGEQALAFKLQLNLTKDLFKSYNALGLLAWNESRLGDAVILFGKAAAAAKAVGDLKGLTAVSSNLALVNTDLGDFGAAGTGFRAARDNARRLGDARLEGNALTNLGMLRIRTGDPQAAIVVLEEARQRYRTIAYATGEQNALGQLGTAYAALGEPHLALATLDSALAAARAQGLRQSEASDLEAMAQLYQEAGDLRRSLDLYANAQTINHDLNLDEETGADLRSQAEIHLALGDLAGAQRDVAIARGIHRRIKARVDEIGDALLLADVLDRAGRHAGSRTELATARRLAAGLEARPVHMEVALAEARIADRAGDARKVLLALAAARGELGRGGYGTEWEAAALLARAYARLGQLPAAIVAGREAVAAIERVRGNFGSGFLRSNYLADRTTAYADLVSALARVGRLDEALEVSDAAHGRALLEHLAIGDDSAAHSSATTTLGNREALLRRIDQLAVKLASIERDAGPHPDSAARFAVTDLSQRLQAARAEYEALVVQTLEETTPTTALLGGGSVRARDVRASLESGEVLLEYLVTADRVMVFAVTPDTLRFFETRIPIENLASRVRLARDFLANAESARELPPPALGGLYDALLGPIERVGALAAAHSVVIVPHGLLTYLPFAALRNDATGRYVVEDHAVSYLPSASALPALRRGRIATWTAAPDGSAAVFVPDPLALRATRGEASAVERSLTDTRVWLGTQATEARLRTALATLPIVHVAGHGVMNAANPMFSRLELARGDGTPGDDGRLEVHELLDLQVVSKLVFLSGCETGLGTAWSSAFARGEDYTTLAQAFLFAGARGIIATLWRVEDDGAAVFAQRFYEHLRNAPPAEALAAAQREMLADPRYRAPYYWAAYSLSGVGDRIVDSEASTRVSVR